MCQWCQLSVKSHNSCCLYQHTWWEKYANVDWQMLPPSVVSFNAGCATKIAIVANNNFDSMLLGECCNELSCNKFYSFKRFDKRYDCELCSRKSAHHTVIHKPSCVDVSLHCNQASKITLVEQRCFIVCHHTLSVHIYTYIYAHVCVLDGFLLVWNIKEKFI